jgi:hypothetical protein
MLRFRSLHIIGASLCALALSAAPAFAQEEEGCESDCVQPGDPTVLVDGGTMVTRATVGPVFSVASTTLDTARNQSINQAASAEILEENEEFKRIRVQCTANTFPGGVATGIVDCYLQSRGRDHGIFNATDDDANPGPLDVAITETIEVPTDKYRVCVRSRALFIDTTFFESPLVCS